MPKGEETGESEAEESTDQNECRHDHSGADAQEGGAHGVLGGDAFDVLLAKTGEEVQ